MAPKAHREEVLGDFSVDEYVALQRTIHRVGRALAAVLPVERLYVLSLGSRQGNSHVHWHLAPLPPGVPYEEQQLAALDWGEHGRRVLEVTDAEQAELAARIRGVLRASGSEPQTRR